MREAVVGRIQDSYKASARSTRSGTGVVVISIVERSVVAARERASPGASLELGEAELPAVRHHSHTFPTMSYTRKGRANTLA